MLSSGLMMMDVDFMMMMETGPSLSEMETGRSLSEMMRHHDRTSLSVVGEPYKPLGGGEITVQAFRWW